MEQLRFDMIDATTDLRQELHARTESLNEVKARNADLERKLEGINSDGPGEEGCDKVRTNT